MPFDGAGVYSLPSGSSAVTGATILASVHNNPVTDIASALSQLLLRSGVAAMTGNLVMGSNKITGLAAGSTAGDAVRYEQAGLLAVANIFTADQTIRSADAGAGQGPALTLDRNSASPADSDLLGQLLFTGRNDAAETITYSRVLIQATDVTDGTEDGKMYLQTLANGTITTGITLEGTVATIPGTLTVTGASTLSTIELGHASDTTLSRVSAGVAAIEGATIRTGTVGETVGGTGATSFQAAADNILGGAATSTGTPTYVVVMESGVAKQITLANFIQKALDAVPATAFIQNGDLMLLRDVSANGWKYMKLEENNPDYPFVDTKGWDVP